MVSLQYYSFISMAAINQSPSIAIQQKYNKQIGIKIGKQIRQRSTKQQIVPSPMSSLLAVCWRNNTSFKFKYRLIPVP